jgi:hypothetical protein
MEIIMATISRHCCHAGAGIAGSLCLSISFPSRGHVFLTSNAFEISGIQVKELEILQYWNDVRGVVVLYKNPRFYMLNVRPGPTCVQVAPEFTRRLDTIIQCKL